MFKYVLIYLGIIQCVAFLSMYVDKKKAIKGHYRIPEKTLFLYAFLGGSIGSLLGMHICRHKTKHKRFVYGMPLILFMQGALCYMIFTLVK